ncbi:MAG TPA: hypothetical protein VGP51_01565 [Nocardioidaceae bacterium]|jgi:hypothetical protein|nr:hypothetical protein [Actinomycetota bacterium]MDQ3421833.1 hypothetical protein [Actinomycetota bacterium]HEV8055153.1 hypothetical protein [Nocardioidaceae bacterium]
MKNYTTSSTPQSAARARMLAGTFVAAPCAAPITAPFGGAVAAHDVDAPGHPAWSPPV